MAERGCRWHLRMQAKARFAMASSVDLPTDLAGRLRFGKLRAGRARGVVYQLRIVFARAA